MTLTIELTPENEVLLTERAARFGKSVPDYVRDLLKPHMTPPIDFERIVKPLDEAYSAGDKSEDELVELIHKVRRDISAERQARS